MSSYPQLYSSHDDFKKKGGHVRRTILLDIKNRQTQAKNELEQARMNLVQCSYIDDPLKWNMLLETVTKLAIKLNDITNELTQLENIHVNENRGILPY